MLGDAAPEAVAAALLSSLGAIFLARFALSFFNAIWRYFIRPGKDLKVYGKWAIVTGATDGIGKALCQELAKRRINVVLISRTESRLQELSSSLEDKYQIQTRYIVLDFTEPSEDVCRKVREATSELNLGILVNNVGMSYPHAEFLDLLDEKTIADIAQVNIHGTTQMIRGVLPKFLEKKRGAVLNVGSGAATVLPSDPLYSVYAASKAYVEQLTRSLAVEYKDKGIDFQLQAPLYVATKMAKNLTNRPESGDVRPFCLEADRLRDGLYSLLGARVHVERDPQPSLGHHRPHEAQHVPQYPQEGLQEEGGSQQEQVMCPPPSNTSPLWSAALCSA
uniref:Beta-keto reductase n=1 Tax=Tetraselmis sp. GSL018 TaxID=582737 RepID=A0A061QPS4_9CHLO